MGTLDWSLFSALRMEFGKLQFDEPIQDSYVGATIGRPPTYRLWIRRIRCKIPAFFHRAADSRPYILCLTLCDELQFVLGYKNVRYPKVPDISFEIR